MKNLLTILAILMATPSFIFSNKETEQLNNFNEKARIRLEEQQQEHDKEMNEIRTRDEEQQKEHDETMASEMRASKEKNEKLRNAEQMVEDLCEELNVPMPTVIINDRLEDSFFKEKKIDDRFLNACASNFNDGSDFIIIGKGIILGEKALSHGALRYLIAHELGHLYHNHSKQKVSLQESFPNKIFNLKSAAFFSSLGILSGITSVSGLQSNLGLKSGLALMTPAVAYIGLILSRLKHSRKCEYEADAFAFKIKGFKPEHAAEFLEKHQTHYVTRHRLCPIFGEKTLNYIGDSNPYSIISTHPSHTNRLARFKETEQPEQKEALPENKISD